MPGIQERFSSAFLPGFPKAFDNSLRPPELPQGHAILNLINSFNINVYLLLISKEWGDF